jgi:hypothetical protein
LSYAVLEGQAIAKVNYRRVPMENQSHNQGVTASLVLENHRTAFLPHYFGGKSFLLAEPLLYSWMDRLSADYTGGFWNFYELSNGGFYLAPEALNTFAIEVEGNCYSGRVSADAAGIIATFFALGQLANTITDANEAGPLIDRYHYLLEFADSHPEGGAIFQAID